MNIFNDIKAIYTKKEVTTKYDQSAVIFLLKYLALDKKSLPIIANLSKFLFFIEPQHLFYLIYLSIPKRYPVPYLKYIKKSKVVKEDKLYSRIAEHFGWSQRELELNKVFLEAEIEPNRKEWKKKLAL